MKHSIRILVLGGMGLAVALLLCACGSDRAATADPPLSTTTTAAATTTVAPTTTTKPASTTTVAPTTTTAPSTVITDDLVIQASYLVVQAKDKVHILDSPGGATVQTLDRLNVVKRVTTLLVTRSKTMWGVPNWYEILYPSRPNGSKGWVSGAEVTVSTLSTAVVVQLGAHRLTLFDHGRKVADYPVGLGTDANPTPTGDFFAIAILRHPSSTTYGPYAIVTSAFSETLTDWPYGGVVGIHGTSNTSSVGQNVSHGCIRLYNSDITQLAQAVSLGTPIFIIP